MTKTRRVSRKPFLLASALIAGLPLFTPLAAAQDATEQAAAEEDQDIVVVGTQIRGAQVTDALPVTVLSEEDIDAIAPTSGDDLFRSIPQAGDVTFNEARLTGGINDARGDTASVNLRGIGTGNTLMLLNGRRMVLHPAIQVENLVPVATVNVNAIPTAGVRRVEVLRDGASAIYGTDAVAGVINTVLRDNYEGLDIEFEGSRAADSAMDQLDLSIQAGVDLNGGRTNISFFGNFTDRDPLFADDRDFSRSSDLRPLISPNSPFFGDDDFRNTSTDTPWPEFRRLVSSVANPYGLSTAALSMNGSTITTVSGGASVFHIQPLTNASCASVEYPVGFGTCFDNSVVSTTGADENLRYNSNDERTLWGDVIRNNAFVFVNHDFGDVELFAELGGYTSELTSFRDQETNLTTQRLIVPATNYWNPFGPTGSPNRVAVTNAPAGGLNFELQDYRLVDAGALRVNVEQYVYRALTGLRGEVAGWDWESALLYSEAETDDTMRQPSMTLFQNALNDATPDAYNPFTGGDPNDPANGDASANAQSVIDSFMVDVTRRSATSMAMADFRISRPDLFEIWGGGVGLAAGVEFRHETYEDDRDDRLDGTIYYQPFWDDTVLDDDAERLISDVMGASPTPDTEGERDVFSAYAELALPIVSPDMNIPFVHSLEAQLAVRYEEYSEFGDITRPRVAVAWSPTEWLMFRSAWSEGFRAPNLPQQHERGILRSNTRTDWVRCEAQLQNGVIANFDACSQSQSVQSNRSGSETLEPETSENFTAGFVFQPTFMPSGWGEFTVTADYWSVEQDAVIGLLGDSNAITLDYLRRMQGSTNPNVIRAPADPDDDTLFSGAFDNNGVALVPAGEILQVIDNYRNLGPREVEGYDIGIFYEVDDTPLGDWNVNLNFARLLTFFQAPGPEQQELLDAQAAGLIDPFPNVPGAESIIEENGRPKWRASSTITWRAGQWGAGLFSAYVGGVNDTGAALADGTLWRIKPWLTHNAYLQYTIESDDSSFIDDVRVRFGARNIFDEQPPLADSDTGYIGDLHSPRGRTVYFSVRTRF
jgi:iron complex outermembrane receptor protein